MHPQFKQFILVALLIILGSYVTMAQLPMIVNIDCLDEGDATIDLDRKDFANGNTTNHSEGYFLNFDLPADSFGPCTKISKVIVTINVTNFFQAIPSGCGLFGYFENIYFSDSNLGLTPASINVSNLFSEENDSDPFSFNSTIEITCADLMNSSIGTNIPFGGQFGYDLIPAISPQSCASGQSMVSDGNITLEFEVCVDVEIDIAGAADVDLQAPVNPVCLGDDIILIENDPDNVDWDWSGPNGFSDNGNNNPIISPSTSPDFGLFSVTVTDGDGCTATDEITVNESPAPNATATAADLDVCVGQDIELDETGGDGDMWMWSGPNGTVPSVQDPVISSSTVADLGIYTVTVTDAQGCTSTSEVTINAGPPPTANATAANTTVCPGQDIVLDEDAGDAQSWVWSGPNGFNSTCLLYTSPSPRDATLSRMPSSA